MGGGTPTYFSGQQLAAVLSACGHQFDLSGALEITSEVNPGTVNRAKLEEMRGAGITRLSIGVQSFSDRLLAMLGRRHRGSQAEDCVKLAREVGYENLALDLIYGLPTQSLEEWEETLRRALRAEPDHLSLYLLMVEPGTKLESQIRAGELVYPEAELVADMDDLAQQLLEEQGFRRYEVSSYTRPGKECLHNHVYWRDQEYVGLGCGAVSYLDGWRQKRISHPHYYCLAVESGRSPVVEAERLGEAKAAKDTISLALRTHEGLSIEALLSRYPTLDRQALEGFFAHLPQEWLIREAERIRLTRRGLDLHSEIYFSLMDTWLLPV